MKLKKICSILKINTNDSNFDKDIDIYSVSDDSRNTKKKDLYISLKKNQNNSHDYLKEAIGKGCKVVFSDYQIENPRTIHKNLIRAYARQSHERARSTGASKCLW